MKLNKLPKTTTKSKKRVGRGYGSGKGGHTVGRGQKGQKSRGKVGLLFEGTKMRKSLIKRLPMRRGKERFKSFKTKPIILNVKYLNVFEKNKEVTLKSLIKKGLVDKEAEKVGVKILGDGELEKKLIVKLPVSKGAKKKIEKAGGKVIDAKNAKEKKAKKSIDAKNAKKKDAKDPNASRRGAGAKKKKAKPAKKTTVKSKTRKLPKKTKKTKK